MEMSSFDPLPENRAKTSPFMRIFTEQFSGPDREFWPRSVIFRRFGPIRLGLESPPEVPLLVSIIFRRFGPIWLGLESPPEVPLLVSIIFRRFGPIWLGHQKCYFWCRLLVRRPASARSHDWGTKLGRRPLAVKDPKVRDADKKQRKWIPGERLRF